MTSTSKSTQGEEAGGDDVSSLVAEILSAHVFASHNNRTVGFSPFVVLLLCTCVRTYSIIHTRLTRPHVRKVNLSKGGGAPD